MLYLSTLKIKIMAQSKSMKTYKRRREKAYNEACFSVGNYIFQYESLLESIRYTINSCALKSGLRNSTIIDILVHDSTGKPLLDYLIGCLYQMFPEQMEDALIGKHVKSIFEGIRKAYEKRNEFAHSNYEFQFIHCLIIF